MKVYCAECDNACSDKAPYCPRCGHPLQALQPPPMQQPVQLIEQTAKRWKMEILVAAGICILGVTTCSLGVADARLDGGGEGMIAVGAFLALAGFLGVIVVRVIAWWYHG